MTTLALSIRQPWAWLIVNGFKDVENRTWGTQHRGPLLIHASMTFDEDCDLEWCQARLGLGHGMAMPESIDAYPRGGIVGRATLVGSFLPGGHIEGWTRAFIEDSPWFTGPLGWALKDAKARPLQVCRGQQGLFTPDFSTAYKAQPKRRRR